MANIVFITPNNAATSYQSLAVKYSAIEPPTWALLLAESVRAKGHSPIIIDTLARPVSDISIGETIAAAQPSMIVFVVYGQNVNAGSTNMAGAVRLAEALKGMGLLAPIGFVGSHLQALPKETLIKESCIDFVCLNEGVYALSEALDAEVAKVEDLVGISGLAVRIDCDIIFTGPAKVVPNERMDIDMPGYAWDLLPFDKEPLD